MLRLILSFVVIAIFTTTCNASGLLLKLLHNVYSAPDCFGDISEHYSMKAANALKSGDTSSSVRAANLSLQWATYSQDKSKSHAVRVKANTLLARISFERNQLGDAKEYVTSALADTVVLKVQPIDIALLSAIGANCMYKLNLKDESMNLLKIAQRQLIKCSNYSSAFNEEDSEKLSYAMQRVNITMKEIEESERATGPIEMILIGGVLLSIIGLIVLTFFHVKIKIQKNSSG